MKILFIGSVEFSGQMLETLLGIPEAEVIAIATKSQSKLNSDHFDLSGYANQFDIPYKYVKDINAPHIIDWVKSFHPEVIFCFGWSSLINKELIQGIPKGIIGYHPTKLPQNRGRHPLIWALALGLKETASTFFFMDEGPDSGDIVHQEIVKITTKDDARSLYDKIIIVARNQLKTWVPLMHFGKLKTIKQDHNKANYWRKRYKKDGEIDFRMSTDSIFNLVRALTKPYVGAHAVFQNKEYKVWVVKPGVNISPNSEPGKVLEVNQNGILVKTGDGSILLTKHEIPSIINKSDYFS